MTNGAWQGNGKWIGEASCRVAAWPLEFKSRKKLSMRWLRRATFVAVATTAAVVGVSAQAQASLNAGWIFTLNGNGYSANGAFFDADLHGYAGIEKLTVCDNESDGRGVRASVSVVGDDNFVVQVVDPSHDGHCASTAFDMFKEESPLLLTVCEYAGSKEYNCNDALAIS